ncbi:MAG: diguanylate cyclase [Gammaproteobacteria bacterium]|nr:diguanylate cyclase [Gammaproteobacteria bacterium]MBU1733141.1 diguanylate cyclase [Gammaproteobacteria bacterium]MBU1892189.1 diguanylate cyclase [Gammaproteobacteria bacterium]
MKPLSVWSYVFSLGMWLSLCFGAAATVIELNIRDAERDLTLYGDAYSDHLDKEMISSEVILKGFSAFFGAVGSTDQLKATRYVRQVIEANPQIFALEIVQSVAKNQLAEFVSRKRRNGIPNFTVKSFSYGSDRKWQALKDKPLYYPIVFIEPMLSGSEDVLGLDVESVPFLQRAMSESLQRRAPVASHPFRLIEGNLAYVVFCPITQAFRRNGSPLAHSTQDELVVDMVIDAAKLAEPIKFPVFDGGTVRVYHKDFSPEDTKGQLLEITGKARSPIENAIFPAFVYQKSLVTMGEPFSLMVWRQIGWSDLSLGLLALMAMLTLMSSLLLLAFLRAHQQGRILNIENQNRLWQLANHDALTGLPNRMLLTDRLEQLLARMRRQEKQLAVMFLDLDDFKQVNDTYGHDFGDQLLKLVAERLRSSVRADDTVARMSGDEFIILIGSVENQEALTAVRQKIQQTLSEGFQIEEQLFRVRASIGIALFPEDGDAPESLIRQADKRMYADKQAAGVRAPQG